MNSNAMLSWLIVIAICSLAVYRLSELVTIDEIAQPVRELMGVYALGENGRPVTFTGKLFECPYCLGIWFAFLCALFFDRSITFPLTWFAIAGGQAYLQTTGGRQ